jgi:NitT/TauT family transport system substrate-binding protein
MEETMSGNDGLKISRRVALAGMAAAVAFPSRAAELRKVGFGFAQAAISPILINMIVPMQLGYYKQEGLEAEMLPLGTNSAVMASLGQGRLAFAVGVPSFILPAVAKGIDPPGICFFEYTYPFKWAVAVTPDSPVRAFADLKGKTIGVSGFGITDYPIGKILIRMSGLDPEKDVQWLAVGEGSSGGQALERGNIAALVDYDTGFGRLEAAGIKMRYLPLPPDVPKVGGLYISATSDFLSKDRATAIGFARAVAKGTIFVETNPEASAYIFLKTYPEAAPRASTIQEQVKAILNPIEKRVPLLSHYDKSINDIGRILPSEWIEELKFAGLEDKIKDTSRFFTNDLVGEINDFDRHEIVEQAKNFKLPYKS